jgi:hypothetical protein
MKRKFKDGYYCSIDYLAMATYRVTPALRTQVEYLQEIADSNFTRDYEGTELLDIRFYSPEHKKVNMEEATEIVKVKKEGWINICKGSFKSWVTGPYDTHEEADRQATIDCIDCIQIFWEE